MTTTARLTFQDELVKLRCLVLELAYKVEGNGKLILEFLENKESVTELSRQIKSIDKEVDEARWNVHDFGDELIVLQQPVAKDFRYIIASIQVTDDVERIGDHFKKIAKQLEKADLSKEEIPEEMIEMARLSLNMLSKSIIAYKGIFDEKTNEIANLDDQVDKLYKKAVKKTIDLIKHAPEEKVDALSKLFFMAQNFERAADHSAKIGHLVNFAVTGIRNKK